MSNSRTHSVQIPAKGKADYTIEFVPLAMTSSPPPGLVENRSQPSLGDENDLLQNDELGSDGKLVRLSGSLFFALPDGGAVLYKLEGFSEGPEAASTTELETPAKTALAFTVPVANWLRRPQRCRSSIYTSRVLLTSRDLLKIAMVRVKYVNTGCCTLVLCFHAQNMLLHAVILPY